MRIAAGYGTVFVRKDSVNEIRAVVYKAKSDPTRADTDGDGYLDYGIKKDGDMADPHPFESDVIRNKITDSVFLSQSKMQIVVKFIMEETKDGMKSMNQVFLI